MSRKGQGISINMVIIAAIALLVLVVAIVLVGKSGRNIDSNAGTKSCLAQGGTCKTGSCPTGEEDLSSKGITCPTLNDEKQICCRYNYNG